jgi:hypothetical protein
MIEIDMNHGYKTIVDEEDADMSLYTWYVFTTKRSISRYAMHGVNRDNKVITYSLHRIIMERILGRKLDSSDIVDHINRNGLDNRRCNLRLATATLNSRNKPLQKNNTSGYRGVRKRFGKYYAEASVDGKKIHLGIFATPEEASSVYLAKYHELYGEYPPEYMDGSKELPDIKFGQALIEAWEKYRENNPDPIKNICDMCGRLVPYKDIVSGMARCVMVTPDTEYTSETYEILCAKCNWGDTSLCKFNKSGYKGVYQSGKLWRSRIWFNGDIINVGTFSTPELAHQAYTAKHNELYKEQ